MKYEIVLIKNAFFEKLHTLQALKTNVKGHKFFESTTLRRKISAKYENITKYSNPKFKKYYLTFFMRRLTGKMVFFKNGA